MISENTVVIEGVFGYLSSHTSQQVSHRKIFCTKFYARLFVHLR